MRDFARDFGGEDGDEGATREDAGVAVGGGLGGAGGDAVYDDDALLVAE